MGNADHEKNGQMSGEIRATPEMRVGGNRKKTHAWRGKFRPRPRALRAAPEPKNRHTCSSWAEPSTAVKG